MFLFLYLADHVEAILDSATAFWAVFEPFWNSSPIDPRNFGTASRRFRELVERSEYDVIHVVPPTASILAGHALRPLLGLVFTRMLVSARAEHGEGNNPQAAKCANILVTNAEAWDAVYERVLRLAIPVTSEVDRSGRAARRSLRLQYV